MTKSNNFSEKDLAAQIIKYLKSDGYEIYQEVPMGGIAADIVAVAGPVLVVVETKKNLGLDVLEQCKNWLNHANMVYAGVFKPKRSQTTFGRQVARTFGIGTLEVNVAKYQSIEEADVSEHIRPDFRRKIDNRLRDALRPEMMTGEYGDAGTNRGGRFTPFKQTTEALLDVVRRSGPITLKDAISQIKTHYASGAAARVNLKKYIENGVIKGLTHEIKDGKFILSPVLQ